MDRFLEGQNNSKLKKLILSNMIDYKKVIESLFVQHNRLVEGYTPIQRLAYIVNTHDSTTMKELRLLLKRVSLGIVSLTSQEFDNFLIKHSGSQPQNGVIYDDMSDTESGSIEEIVLG